LADCEFAKLEEQTCEVNLLMFLMVLFLLPASLTRADEVNGNVSASASRSTFQLIANPAFEACLSGSKAATATVTVVKGKLNDTLTIKFAMQNRNWRLIYSLFRTLRFSRMGAPTHFLGNFGLAWYQSDIETDRFGNASATIHTILVNQIFGFDAGTGLAPVNTFEVGFWFNDPADVADCNFAGPPTPFNGEHNAGPLAMISGADPTTKLGPLCLDPNTSGPEATCNP
jgi:hypothetical protein